MNGKFPTIRLKLAVVVLTLLAIVVNLAVALRTDIQLRQRGLEEAVSDACQMLVAFVDHAVRLLDYGDSQLRAARDVYLRMGGGESFREFLAATELQHGDSLIVAITICDRDGQVVFDSEKRGPLNVTAVGVDYFHYFQAHDDDVPYIDPTRLGRVQQKYLFRIVRRMSRGGQFDGVVILNRQPEYLANFTRQFNLGPNAV